MINTEEITKRLEKVLQFYSLSAAAFADKIQVQRSSISHLLTGRNKPSLEFVLKVTAAFPEVDLYWLLEGKGSFPREAKKIPQESSTAENNKDLSPPNPKGSKSVKKIVLLYDDGSFESYGENI
jgi:plasmid maintenance system antidote protein VapI